MITRFVSFAFVAGLLSFVTPARAEMKPGDRAADFQSSSKAGSPIRLSSLRGKIVLVDFWASWCEPCKRELPILDRLAPRLRARGIEIVTVNIDDDAKNEERFLKDKGLHAITVVHDADKSIIAKYEPPKMPSSFVIDRNGVVRAINAGFEEGDEQKIEKQLLEWAAK